MATVVGLISWSDPLDGPRDSYQLEFDLFPGVPWQGRSPRVLTRGYLGVIFNQRGEKHERLFRDPNQLELWPTEQKAKARRAEAPSASTLLPLPRRL